MEKANGANTPAKIERERLNGATAPKRLGKGYMDLAPLDKPLDKPLEDTTETGALHRSLEYRRKTASQDLTALTKSYPHEDAAVLAHSEKIRTSYQRTVEAIVDTGNLLMVAKKALHGRFGLMFRYLPFSQRQADYLMVIARHPILGDSQYFANLPQSWATLHVLAGLTAEQVKTRIDSGHINPSMTMREAKLISSGNGTIGKQHALRLIGELVAFTSYCTPQELIDYSYAAELTPVNELAAWLTEWASLSAAHIARQEAEGEEASKEHSARWKREEKDKPKVELGWERQAREDEARETWGLIADARRAGDEEEVARLTDRLVALSKPKDTPSDGQGSLLMGDDAG